MTAFLQPILVLLWKDILLEIRSKDLVISVLVFGLLVVIIFNFALNASSQQTAALATEDRDLILTDGPGLKELRGGRFADIPRERIEAEIIYGFDTADQPGARFARGELIADFERRVAAWVTCQSALESEANPKVAAVYVKTARTVVMMASVRTPGVRPVATVVGRIRSTRISTAVSTTVTTTVTTAVAAVPAVPAVRRAMCRLGGRSEHTAGTQYQ